HSINLRYASPNGRSAAARANDIDSTIEALARQRSGNLFFSQNLLGLSASTYGQSTFSLNPYFHAHLNDPNGAFRYDTGLSLNADINLARGWWLSGAIRGSVHETVTKSSQTSNSRLPHVRSDVTEYRR